MFCEFPLEFPQILNISHKPPFESFSRSEPCYSTSGARSFIGKGTGFNVLSLVYNEVLFICKVYKNVVNTLKCSVLYEIQ